MVFQVMPHVSHLQITVLGNHSEQRALIGSAGAHHRGDGFVKDDTAAYKEVLLKFPVARNVNGHEALLRLGASRSLAVLHNGSAEPALVEVQHLAIAVHAVDQTGVVKDELAHVESLINALMQDAVRIRKVQYFRTTVVGRSMTRRRKARAQRSSEAVERVPPQPAERRTPSQTLFIHHLSSPPSNTHKQRHDATWLNSTFIKVTG